MKKIWFAGALYVAATNALSSEDQSIGASQFDDEMLSSLDNIFAQTDAEQFGGSFAQTGLGQTMNPIAQAKEAMKELKSSVDQDDAKKMGYAEYNVFKKLRDIFRKRGKKADEIFKKLKLLLKKGWEGKKTLEKLAKGDDDGKGDDSDDDDKKKEKDSDKKKSTGKADRKKKSKKSKKKKGGKKKK